MGILTKLAEIGLRMKEKPKTICEKCGSSRFIHRAHSRKCVKCGKKVRF